MQVVGAGLLAVRLVLGERRRDGSPEHARASGWWRLAGRASITLLVVPAAVYVASYAGRLPGQMFVAPWHDDSWVQAFLERQRYMWQFHLALADHSPYSSPAWSWLLLKRPVAMYFGVAPDGDYVEVMAVGSPVVWWTAVLALVWQAFRLARRRRFAVNAAFVALLGVGATLFPWLLLESSRSQTFLYYMCPATPFLCLSLAAVAAGLARMAGGRWLLAVWAAASLAAFAFAYPVLTARPLEPGSWRQRVLFGDCAPYDADRPTDRPGPAPGGWCWS
jgi:dolichyl-phosphate-mannose-protein mannosyltransferase